MPDAFPQYPARPSRQPRVGDPREQGQRRPDRTAPPAFVSCCRLKPFDERGGTTTVDLPADVPTAPQRVPPVRSTGRARRVRWVTCLLRLFRGSFLLTRVADALFTSLTLDAIHRPRASYRATTTEATTPRGGKVSRRDNGRCANVGTALCNGEYDRGRHRHNAIVHLRFVWRRIAGTSLRRLLLVR